jgi:lysozyme family protein
LADFTVAYAITMAYEGGYSNDGDDVGGETYKGVARRYYPSWAGWVIIDAQKFNPNFPECLEDLPDLQQHVKNFFKATYWDVMWGDDMPNQGIANEMFDTGVNMGVSRAVTYLQGGLNILNRNQQNYPDIVEDGHFGPTTFSTLQKYLSIDSNEYLLKVMVILRGMHYIEYMRKSPTQERFARGWLNRIIIK